MSTSDKEIHAHVHNLYSLLLDKFKEEVVTSCENGALAKAIANRETKQFFANFYKLATNLVEPIQKNNLDELSDQQLADYLVKEFANTDVCEWRKVHTYSPELESYRQLLIKRAKKYYARALNFGWQGLK